MTTTKLHYNMNTIGKIICLFVVLLAVCDARSAPRTKAKKYFTLEQVLSDGNLAQKYFNGTWISSTEFLYSKFGQAGLYKYDVETLKEELFVSKDVLSQLNTTSVTLSPDHKYLMAQTDYQAGFRHSSSAKCAIYNRETKEITKLANDQRVQVCEFTGDTHSVIFILLNDVYYLKDAIVSKEEVRLTNDGVPDVIYNGVPDWVYEEEVLGAGSATWLSPLGSRMAIASFNDSQVNVTFYVTFGELGSLEDQYPVKHDLRYPKVGTKNPTVALRIIDLNKEGSTWVTLPAPVDIVSEDHILGTVKWVSEDELAALWLNRRQNLSVLVMCNTNTANCKPELIRTEPDGWIEITTPIFSKDGRSFLDIVPINQNSESTDEWYSLVQYNRDNLSVVTALSSGETTVHSIDGWNEESDLIYYSSTLQDQPWQKHLMVAGSRSCCVSCTVTGHEGNLCRQATTKMAPGGKYYVLTCQGAAPAIVTIYSTKDDKPIKVWQDNSALSNVLQDYWLPQQINLRVPVAGGFEGAVKFFLPPQLNLENPSEKFPMVVNIYTGPNSVRVQDTFGISFQTFMATNRSVIYCLLEGRGSGNKGKDMLFSVNNRLGTVEIEDVLNITKQLVSRYSWIDEKNIGIWGWSYGGFATAMALTKDKDHIFKCGISVAPVTSWLYYDSIYTERYMGLPTPQDNLLGYASADVSLRANHLRGRHFLLLHGVADDNVHYQNAMILSRALQILDIPFEQMSYPDEDHSLAGVSSHVYHTIDDYWLRCFEAPEGSRSLSLG